MTRSHAEVTREAGRLQEEIARLFDRTSLAGYGDVAREMNELENGGCAGGAGRVGGRNIGVQSIDDGAVLERRNSSDGRMRLAREG